MSVLPYRKWNITWSKSIDENLKKVEEFVSKFLMILIKTGKQKYRPAIVIKSYPSHVKVQLMTTEPSNHNYFKIKIDNQIQYIRPIYYRTKPIEIDKKSKLFQKIVEMECKENLGYEINLNKIQSLEKENKQLKKQICVQSLKLKNRNHE